jgi:hypothetical protein
MKKTILLLACLVVILNGCADTTNTPVAIRIDDFKVTAPEFEEAYRDSSFAREDSVVSRSQFLDNFLARKLILKEAHAQGLDRDAQFLKDVEFFWQQSLIKLMLDKKIKELALETQITDEEVRAYYEAHKDGDFKEKPLSSVYAQVKWLLLKSKQQKAIDTWISSLKDNAKIEIDYEALKIK